LPIKPHPLRKFSRNEDGAVAIIVALMLTVLFGFVAFGVDLGQIYRDQNRLQAQADLAAMSAVVDLINAQDRARDVLDRNGSTHVALKPPQCGRYVPNPDIAPESRFTELLSCDSDANAVQLDVSNATPLTFSRMFLDRNSIDLSATATAMQSKGASFTLGSGLARMEGGVINQLTGANITFTALDYNALLDGQVTLLDFLDELSTEIGFEAGNYVDLLGLDVGLPEVLASLARTQIGQAADTLNQLAATASAQSVELARIITLADPTLGLVIDDLLDRTEVSALDILAATLDVISANRAIELDVGVTVPGLLGLESSLVLQERAQNSGWVSVGDVGAKLHTAQTRLWTELELAPSLFNGLGVSVEDILSLPVYLEVANAEAELTHVNCRPDHPHAVVASFDTGANPLDGASGTHVAELFIGKISEERRLSGQKLTADDFDYVDFLNISFSVTVLIIPIRINLVTLQVKGHAVVGQSDTGVVNFTQQNVIDGEVRRSISSEAALSSAVISLLGDGISIRRKPGQLELLNLLGSVLNAALNTVGNVISLLSGVLSGNVLVAAVDAALDATLEAAGVQVGTADLELVVTADPEPVGTTCGAPRLVQ